MTVADPSTAAGGALQAAARATGISSRTAEVATAQVHATLAVAHEARTANLIAALAVLDDPASRDALAQQIRARLLDAR